LYFFKKNSSFSKFRSLWCNSITKSKTWT